MVSAKRVVLFATEADVSVTLTQCAKFVFGEIPANFVLSRTAAHLSGKLNFSHFFNVLGFPVSRALFTNILVAIVVLDGLNTVTFLQFIIRKVFALFNRASIAFRIGIILFHRNLTETRFTPILFPI